MSVCGYSRYYLYRIPYICPKMMCAPPLSNPMIIQCENKAGIHDGRVRNLDYSLGNSDSEKTAQPVFSIDDTKSISMGELGV